MNFLTRMTRDEINEIGQQIARLRDEGDDYVIVAVGARGPNIDCDDGNAVATVRMGQDEATSEALYLHDAIALARGKILRERAAKAKAREKKQAGEGA